MGGAISTVFVSNTTRAKNSTYRKIATVTEAICLPSTNCLGRTILRTMPRAPKIKSASVMWPPHVLRSGRRLVVVGPH
jgi:hypothetical protein